MSKRERGNDRDVPVGRPRNPPADSPPSAEGPRAARSVRTESIDSTENGPWHDHPDLATWLKHYDRDTFYELPRSYDSVSMGSAEGCDIRIENAGLSRAHCTLRRRGNRIEMTDQSSKNGTYLDNRREPVFNFGVGESWVVAKTTKLLALNDEMYTWRPAFVDVLGVNPRLGVNPKTPDDLLVAAFNTTNILITGEPGCGHELLAEGIHRISKRRDLDCETVSAFPKTMVATRELIDRVEQATLVLNLLPSKVKESESGSESEVEIADQPREEDAENTTAPSRRGAPEHENTRIDQTFVSMLMSSSYHVRLIVLAPSKSIATEILGADAVPPFHVELTPLRYRTAEILSLLDRAFVTTGGTLRVSHLTQKSQDALEAYLWPGNFNQLQLAARLLDMKARKISFKDCAAALERNDRSLQYWFTDALGLNLESWLSRR